MWYEDHKSNSCYWQQRSSFPQDRLLQKISHIFWKKKRWLLPERWHQNKQTACRYDISGSQVNGPQWQQIAVTHCTAKHVSSSEDKIPSPVSPNSEAIEISWPCEKPALLFPSPVCSKQPRLLAWKGGWPPQPPSTAAPLASLPRSPCTAGLPSPPCRGGLSSAACNL